MREIPSQIADRLSAAAELFAERGLNDTKIEDIAAATGIAKATLYYYYFAGQGRHPHFPAPKTACATSPRTWPPSYTAAAPARSASAL